MANSESEELFADRYRVVELLGEGGMGRVLKCHDRELDRSVAIKVLSAQTTVDAVKRFQKEAVATARLRHPNVVEVYDFGETDGLFYLVMDYLEGESLDRYLARVGALSWEETREIGLAICAGLGHAHESGILHRDLKPSNVLILSSESGDLGIKLVDFGIAKELDGASTMTGSDLILGTPTYISPEAVRGDELSPASDIYSLGCILYECLTGDKPVLGDSAMATMMLKLEVDPPSLRDRFEGEPGVMIDLLINKCLARDPEKRYLSAADLALALENCQFDTSIEIDPVLPEAAAVKSNFRFNFNPFVIASLSISALLSIFFCIRIFQQKPVERNRVELATPACMSAEESRVLDSENHNFYLSDGGWVKVNSDFNDADLQKAVLLYPNQSVWELKEAKINGTGLKHLLSVDVRVLDLSRNTLRPETLDLVARMPGLEKLILIGCSGIRDRDLSRLKPLKRLIFLSVSGPGITKGACKEISRLDNLQGVGLRDLHLGASELRCLAKLPELVSLGLSDCRLDKGAAEVIAGMSHLNRLKLSRTGFDLTVAEAISKSRSIENLEVSHLEAPPRAFLLLGSMPLKTLNLGDTGIDDSTRVALHRELPDCKIQY